MQFVLKVEETFGIKGRGVIVSPWLPLSFFDGKILPRQVELRLPDGATKLVAAMFTIPRQSPPPKETTFVCMLSKIEKSSVPIGTEVWADIESSK
jgi:hypothetical protein